MQHFRGQASLKLHVHSPTHKISQVIVYDHNSSTSYFLTMSKADWPYKQISIFYRLTYEKCKILNLVSIHQHIMT